MIDLKPFIARTDGAPAVLLCMQSFDVGGSECAAVFGNPSAAVRRANTPKKTNALWIGLSPVIQFCAHLFGMLLAVSLVYFRLLVRVALPVVTLVGRFVSWPLVLPFRGALDRALSAVTVRHEAFVMAFWARLSAVVPLTGGARGDAIGMLRRTAVPQKSDRLFAVAGDAVSRARPSRRKMSVPARLSGIVGALASGLGGKSFGDGSHIFTVIRPPVERIAFR